MIFCSDNDIKLPVLRKYCPSNEPIAANAQHEPQAFWSLTSVTPPLSLQSNDSGILRSSEFTNSLELGMFLLNLQSGIVIMKLILEVERFLGEMSYIKLSKLLFSIRKRWRNSSSVRSVNGFIAIVNVTSPWSNCWLCFVILFKFPKKMFILCASSSTVSYTFEYFSFTIYEN